MRSGSVSELQKELKELPAKDVVAICIRLAKYRKENKELLNYLLFESVDEQSYIRKIKEELDQLFGEINRSSAYTTKKGLQKIVRVMNRYIKFSAELQTELELRISFCKKIRSEKIDLEMSPVISNLFYRETAKIKQVFEKLHEDLKYDYQRELETLQIA